MKKITLLLLLFGIIAPVFADNLSSTYTEKNTAHVSFDISMPVDATGYTLHGKNLTGGDIQFTDHGNLISPFLAHETGTLALPLSTDLKNKPFIQTNIHYDIIKLIAPNGLDNIFIKIGTATRTQTVHGLDPYVLKNGTYTWKVPFFAMGREKNTIDHSSSNFQYLQVGSGHDPSHHNSMYTQDIYLFSEAHGNTAITGHPEKVSTANEFLSQQFTSDYSCYADGVWGAGGSDPYRTIIGNCNGSSITFPAGPNLDYVYGSFQLPTVKTPWMATPNDHCFVKGKQHAGCTEASIATTIHYMGQKIRVSINDHITLYAEFGTAYRSITPNNLRYMCKSNVYLKNILPTDDCGKKSYLPGGSSYPYFAVGYEFTSKDNTRYSAKYMYIPVQENANTLSWRDASSTQIYAISVSNKKETNAEIKKNFTEALNEIQKIPGIDQILGKHFFMPILKNNFSETRAAA